MSILREKMINAMKIRGFTPKTQKNYVADVSALARYCNRSPDKLRKEEVQAYLLYLSEERKLSWSSCNCAASSLRFFYKHVLDRQDTRLWIPKRKNMTKLPEILSRKELERFFSALTNPKYRAIFMTAYGAGLRTGEVMHLQVEDIHSDRMMIRVRQGKGRKDRYTLLSARLLTELREYWKIERPVLWLFPGQDSEQPLCHTSLRKSFHRAKNKARIKKAGSIHCLRHCFATHLLEAGVDLRTLQVLMGHNSIRSTARYVQLTAKALGKTRSPLDLLDLSGKQLPQ